MITASIKTFNLVEWIESNGIKAFRGYTDTCKITNQTWSKYIPRQVRQYGVNHYHLHEKLLPYNALLEETVKMQEDLFPRRWHCAASSRTRRLWTWSRHQPAAKAQEIIFKYALTLHPFTNTLYLEYILCLLATFDNGYWRRNRLQIGMSDDFSVCDIYICRWTRRGALFIIHKSHLYPIMSHHYYRTVLFDPTTFRMFLDFPSTIIQASPCDICTRSVVGRINRQSVIGYQYHDRQSSDISLVDDRPQE